MANSAIHQDGPRDGVGGGGAAAERLGRRDTGGGRRHHHSDDGIDVARRTLYRKVQFD